MKIVDGIPTLLSGDGSTRYFPFSGPNVWTLENLSRPAQTKEQLEAMFESALARKKNKK